MRYVIHSKSEQGFWAAGRGWDCKALSDAYVFHMNIYKLPDSIGNDAEWITISYKE